MSAESVTGGATLGVARSFKVGRYTVDLTIPKPLPGQVMMASVEWAPCLPNPSTSEPAEESEADELQITYAVLEL